MKKLNEQGCEVYCAEVVIPGYKRENYKVRVSAEKYDGASGATDKQD